MYKIFEMPLLAATPIDNELILSYVLLAIGLTLIGLFSKYKIFLILTTGPLLYLMYHLSDDSHDGYQVLLISFAGWMLFNVYLAFFGDNND